MTQDTTLTVNTKFQQGYYAIGNEKGDLLFSDGKLVEFCSFSTINEKNYRNYFWKMEQMENFFRIYWKGDWKFTLQYQNKKLVLQEEHEKGDDEEVFQRY